MALNGSKTRLVVPGNKDKLHNQAKQLQAINAKYAKLLASELRNTSRQKFTRFATGRYAEGWKPFVVSGRKASPFKETLNPGEYYVIMNENEPTLTHLLEDGHLLKSTDGTLKYTPAVKHIYVTADKFRDNYEREIEEAAIDLIQADLEDFINALNN